MIAVAVNSLLCDAMRNFVSGVIGTCAFTSAKPKPVAHTSCWSLTTPTATPGSPRYAICPSIHAENSRSAPSTSGLVAMLVVDGADADAATACAAARSGVDDETATAVNARSAATAAARARAARLLGSGYIMRISEGGGR